MQAQQINAEGMQKVILRDLRHDDVGWLVAEHAVHYAASDGFDETFKVVVEDVLVHFMRDFDPKAEKAWIAEQGGQRLGSLLCTRHDATTARLKLFYLIQEARGQGLGRHMLEESIAFARGRGYRQMRVWTYESHRAAGRLYIGLGWKLLQSKPVHNFGCDLVEQSWKIDF